MLTISGSTLAGSNSSQGMSSRLQRWRMAESPGSDDLLDGWSANRRTTGIWVEARRIATRSAGPAAAVLFRESRSEEHTSELQSLMRISYAVLCSKKQNSLTQTPYTKNHQ